MSKKLFHWRNESGELDVFEAANYFAGANDHHQVSNCHNNGPTFSHKLLREGCNNQAWRSGRMSLDLPPVPIQLSSSTAFGISSQIEKPAAGAAIKGKCKQPSSPGGKLASFLNSLFNQKISSKKKKKKLNSAEAVNDEDCHSPSGWMRMRRRRRSSLSELYGKTSSSNIAYKNAASSNSGFRTPPPYPKKSCKDNHNPENMFKFIGSTGISERTTISVHHWADEYPSEENEERKFDDDEYDRGTDSDSSSDLFDLPNREYYSSGLPVYQTNQMNTINSSAPISAPVI